MKVLYSLLKYMYMLIQNIAENKMVLINYLYTVD